MKKIILIIGLILIIISISGCVQETKKEETDNRVSLKITKIDNFKNFIDPYGYRTDTMFDVHITNDGKVPVNLGGRPTQSSIKFYSYYNPNSREEYNQYECIAYTGWLNPGENKIIKLFTVIHRYPDNIEFDLCSETADVIIVRVGSLEENYDLTILDKKSVYMDCSKSD